MKQYQELKDFLKADEKEESLTIQKEKPTMKKYNNRI